MKRIRFGFTIALMLVLATACKATGQPPEATWSTTSSPTASKTAATTALETATAGQGLSTDEDLVANYAGSIKSTAEIDFSLRDLNGKIWTLSELKGKIVLLNFWATWCPPCQMEMPGFQKLYEKFGVDGDVVVLAVASTALEGVSEADSKTEVSQFVKGQKFTFPVLFDADGKVWAKYQQQGIPANYIIDKQGNIRLLVAGAFKDETYLYAALEAVRRADSGE